MMEQRRRRTTNESRTCTIFQAYDEQAFTRESGTIRWSNKEATSHSLPSVHRTPAISLTNSPETPNTFYLFERHTFIFFISKILHSSLDLVCRFRGFGHLACAQFQQLGCRIPRSNSKKKTRTLNRCAVYSRIPALQAIESHIFISCSTRRTIPSTCFLEKMLS